MSRRFDKPILELRHIECEPPAAYAPVLTRFSTVHTVRTWRDKIPTNPDDYAAMIVMGGPMGANDQSEIPWLGEELAFLRRAAETDVPIWGVCLGSQLLAAALGARVWTGPVPEVGVLEICPTPECHDDPVWERFSGSPFPALQWHSDTFDLPEGATRLASSAAYPNQLFRFGRSYGIQFHLEADSQLARQWLEVPEYRSALIATIGADAVTGFIDDISSIEIATRSMASALVEGWLERCVVDAR